ncbi:hypothetical protein Patl1_33462 [Pistacia atlantica]|uniref:Uncharacterized protein n=1 Tax=Pistacia atlantica TaxID=434234 RepID=A0ACC0ZUE9_9ROSI|nr:hypothetical protein Patl1_33462 [Pistacia atlantica]
MLYMHGMEPSEDDYDLSKISQWKVERTVRSSFDPKTLSRQYYDKVSFLIFQTFLINLG